MVKKILTAMAVVFALAVFGALLFVNRLSTRALPDYNKDLDLPGLTAEVKIYRDAYAIPHIYAENEADLYLATGYVLGRDRLWQMDLLRRVTLGRLSEIFGSDLVEVDQLMRALKMSEKSQGILDGAEPELLNSLHAFADGVNLAIEELGGRLPVEFALLGYRPEKWEPIHSVNLIGYMAWDLTMPYTVETVLSKIGKKVSEEQFAELLPDVKQQESTVFPASAVQISEADISQSLLGVTEKLEDWGVQMFEGSNNWAVNGPKTSGGEAIFCNDMHLGLNAPGLWFRVHQVVDGRLNVTGVLLPGQPFVIAGHNEDIAWGMTNVMVDDMDFYEEKLSEDGSSYLYNDEWLALDIREERIRLKGGGDTTVVNRFSHRGPLINDLKDLESPVSMKWTGFGPSNELRTVYLLNRARNWDDFREAVRTFRSVSQNVNYADRFGNIGLHNCAGIPIRPEGMSGLDIYPGWTDDYDWQGLVPFEEQLFIFNPAGGEVSSANNKTAVNDYPYPVSHWFALHYRIDRIRELLAADDDISVADMMRIQTDLESIFVREVKPMILEQLEMRDDLNEEEMELAAGLAEWDNRVLRESKEAALFELFYVKFMRNMLSDEMGAELYKEYTKSSYLARYFLDELLRKGVSSWTDDVNSSGSMESLDDIVVRSLREAAQELKEKSSADPDKWQWGDIHTLTLKHPLASVKLLEFLFHLNSESYPAQGSFHTVAPYAYSLANPFDVNHGASQRHIYVPADWDASYSLIPSGNSGIPASPHYCDETELYMEMEYLPDYFSRKKIVDNARYEQTFRPERSGE